VLTTNIKVFAGFAALALGLSACGDDGGSGKRPSCAQLCARIEAPECPNAAPDCLAACEEDFEATPKRCEDELDALARCFGRATFTCDEDGVPAADRCEQQLDRWARCLESAPSDPDEGNNGGNSGGGNNNGGNNGGGNNNGGNGDGSSDLCEADPSDNACDSCLKGSCCDEISACGPDCQAILSCVELCWDEECIDGCLEEYPAGVQQVAALSTCVATSCEASCSDDTADASELCLPGSIPDGYCDDTGALTVGHDCPGGQPFENCVLSPTGAANVYCCDQ
jgi:hypothetical protein